MTVDSDFHPGAIIQCITPLAPIRSEANEASELETQALYGQSCEIIERGTKNWIKVKIEADQYIGWTDVKHYCVELFSRPYTLGHLIQEVMTVRGRQFLPFGSFLTEGEKSGLSDIGPQLQFCSSDIIKLASKWENAPYLWGGKSILGVDCSGYIQLLFAFFGIQLPRNASQQAVLGKHVPFEEHQAGDVAFFINEKGKVIHVGIIAENQRIWHASGMVRLDFITNEGIVHSDSKNLTHQLHSIKRFF